MQKNIDIDAILTVHLQHEIDIDISMYSPIYIMMFSLFSGDLNMEVICPTKVPLNKLSLSL